MRKFVLLLLLALGFSVCFAFPPPVALQQPDVAVVVDQVTFDQSVDLPSVTPYVLQDQQPAPLLTAIKDENVERINCMVVDLPPGIALLPDIILSNTNTHNDLLLSGQAKNNLTPVIIHSSGGLPY